MISSERLMRGRWIGRDAARSVGGEASLPLVLPWSWSPSGWQPSCARLPLSSSKGQRSPLPRASDSSVGLLDACPHFMQRLDRRASRVLKTMGQRRSVSIGLPRRSHHTRRGLWPSTVSSGGRSTHPPERCPRRGGPLRTGSISVQGTVGTTGSPPPGTVLSGRLATAPAG